MILIFNSSFGSCSCILQSLVLFLYELVQILRTELRTLRSKSTGDSFIGTYGKKHSNGGLFGLFKWNVDFLEKY
jgi:hypothetical protein